MSDIYNWMCGCKDCRHWVKEKEHWGSDIGHCSITLPSTGGQYDYSGGVALCHSYTKDPGRPDPTIGKRLKKESEPSNKKEKETQNEED